MSRLDFGPFYSLQALTFHGGHELDHAAPSLNFFHLLHYFHQNPAPRQGESAGAQRPCMYTKLHDEIYC
jgi:hypothetical protein